LATLGTFILWLGWFGFNGGSQLYMDTAGNVADISRIFSNTNTAAAAGAIVALILTQLLYRKPDLTMTMNGALAGLVSITAEPLMPSLPMATLIGGIGGAIVVFTVPCWTVCGLMMWLVPFRYTCSPVSGAQLRWSSPIRTPISEHSFMPSWLSVCLSQPRPPWSGWH